MPGEENWEGKWEKRWHPLRREWVVYAAHRNSRPWNFDIVEKKNELPAFDPDCFLCPGNTRVSGKQNPDYKDVFIFENDHPVVGMNAPDLGEEELHGGLYRRSGAKAIAKVVCYDPRHNVTLKDLDVDHIASVFRALREEMKFFRAHESVKSVLIVENKASP